MSRSRGPIAVEDDKAGDESMQHVSYVISGNRVIRNLQHLLTETILLVHTSGTELHLYNLSHYTVIYLDLV